MKENEQIGAMRTYMAREGAISNPCASRECELFEPGVGCTSENELKVTQNGVECGDGYGLIRVNLKPTPAECDIELVTNVA